MLFFKATLTQTQMLSDPDLADLENRKPSAYNYTWPIHITAANYMITGTNAKDGVVMLGENEG